MLTVASPLEDASTIAVRAHAVEIALTKARAQRRGKARQSGFDRVLLSGFRAGRSGGARHPRYSCNSAEAKDILSRTEILTGRGSWPPMALTNATDAEIYADGPIFVETRLHESEFHPDAWPPIVVRDPAQVGALWPPRREINTLTAQLDQLYGPAAAHAGGAPEVSRVDRSGVLSEQIYLDYSQERLASYGLQPSNLKSILNARNITLPGRRAGSRVQKYPD